jgi:predicted membrane protein
METNDKTTSDETTKASNSRIWSGLILLIIGAVFFLKNFGINIPDWVISWHMALVAIGLLVGFKRRFHGIGWIIMVLVGGGFTLSEITGMDLSKYYFAVVFIAMGLYLILKPKGDKFCKARFKEHRRFRRRYGRHGMVPPEGGEATEGSYGPQAAGFVYEDREDNDVLESVNVFGGSNQSVLSKNFKGGEIIAVFGGCDVNLTQADFRGTISLEVVAIFGGAKILVPQSWEVKSEVTAIFGGLDDKRALGPINIEDRKILIIKGVALFGGVEIRNF